MLAIEFWQTWHVRFSVSSTVLWFALCAGAGLRQAWPQVQQLPTHRMTFHIVDESGEPIEGAVVSPYALRTIELNELIPWENAPLGPRLRVTSDADGDVVIESPAFMRYQSSDLTIRRLSVHAWHPEYIDARVHVDVSVPDPEPIILEKGAEVHFSAVDSRNQPVSEFVVCMAGPFATNQWFRDADGRRSRGVKPGKWQTMLVQLPSSSSNLFSNVLPLPTRREQSIRIRNVVLAPGTKVAGDLSANVPRPIINGRVFAVAVPQPAGAAQLREDPSLIWRETATIQPDGKFEFPSLPRGGHLQIIATCDGWISTSTMPDNQQSVTGQLFDLNQDRVDVIVDMEPTGSLDVAVVNREGKIAAGVKVHAEANLLFYKSGIQVRNSFENSQDSLRIQLDSTAKSIVYYPLTSSAITDRSGRVLLRELPTNRPVRLSIEHPKYSLPKHQGLRSRSYTVKSIHPEQLRVEIE